jgi:hypothetical protein
LRVASGAHQRFHAGIPLRKEVTEVTSEVPAKKILLTPGVIIEKLGLDDWKRALPLGIFFGIPAFYQQWIILDVETQLLGCFMLFVGTVYQKFGDTIGAALDARGDAILEARNKEEDAAIEMVQNMIEQHKLRMQYTDITRDIVDLQRETMEKSAKLHNLMAPYITREATITLLEMEVSRQVNEWQVEQNKLIHEALSSVTQQVQSDKKLKKAALDEALHTLADPNASQKKDAISSLFVDFFKKSALEAQKELAREKAVTESERSALIERIEAKVSRFSHIDGIHEQAEKAKKLIPTHYTGSLTKAFLEAQAKDRNYAS